MIPRVFTLALVAVMLPGVPRLFAQDPSPRPCVWKAAVTKADITPEPGIWMAGYAARKGPAEKVLQPIFAKALMVEDAEGGRFVFLTMDLIGVSRTFRDAVERLAGEKFGLAPEAILINASHTHSGPMIRLYQPPDGGGEERAPYASIPEEEQPLRVAQTREYNANLLATVDRLLGEAVEKLEPVTLA